MKIKYCSLTGADDAVDVADLSVISVERPFVEWAILLLPAKAGTARCPSTAWIEKFKTYYQGQHRAMHLCDTALLDFIAGKPETLELMAGFDRIQLNLKFGDMDGKYDPAHLVARVRETPNHTFILQYAKDKQSLLPLFADIKNHAVLFDASAGQGIAPKAWEVPLAGHFCGYAGGLNPDNLDHHLELISAVAQDYTTWIDMETGVRTNDIFDLEKCRRVLKTAAPFSIEA